MITRLISLYDSANLRVLCKYLWTYDKQLTRKLYIGNRRARAQLQTRTILVPARNVVVSYVFVGAEPQPAGSAGHLTSSMTSPFDFAWPLSYRLPIANSPLSPVVSEIARHARTTYEPSKCHPGTHPRRRLGIVLVATAICATFCIIYFCYLGQDVLPSVMFVSWLVS